MQILYDKEADAVAIWCKDAVSERTIDISEDIFIDFDKDGRPVGVEILHISEKPELLAKKNVNIPVVAIGGIKHENVAQVAEAGADCIAVISAVVSADNVKEAARKLREKFLAAKKKPEVKSGDAVRSS